MVDEKASRNKLKYDKNTFRVFSGLNGSGKSYHATLEAYEWIKKGGVVMTNYGIDFRKTFPKVDADKVMLFDSISDIKYFRNSLILYDEGHIQLDSRDWAHLEKPDRILLAQLRKLGDKIIVIANEFDRIDSIVRDLTGIVYEHHRAGRLMWWKQFLPQDVKRVKRKLVGLGITWFDQKIANSYNCDELFGYIFEKTLEPKIFYPAYIHHLILAERIALGLETNGKTQTLQPIRESNSGV